MLCQICGKNPATTHIKTVINGKVTEQNLCGYCAAKSGFSNGSLSGLLSSVFGTALQSNTAAFEKTCPCCNATFANIAETGKVGCAECYNTFSDELLVYLKRIHGSVKHAGKHPGSKELVITAIPDRVSELKIKLAKLVSEEKYEEAAVVRDEIKKLEEEK